MIRVAVTGAGGFIGRTLIRDLHRRGYTVRAISRRGPSDLWGKQPRQEHTVLGADWSAALQDVDAVIHLAAIAHRTGASRNSDWPDVERVNVTGSGVLARAAVKHGVRRFVFLSTIGVHGATTRGAERISEESPIAPADDYAVSKLRAEELIRSSLNGSGVSLMIVRPPLVYGANAPGNFSRLVKVVRSGLPLPVGGLRNQRSFLFVANLTDFLTSVALEGSASDETYVLSDQQDMSTPEFLRRLAEALHVRANLISVPPWVLRLLLTAAGRKRDFIRLAGSLQVDSTKATRILGWKPPFSVEAGLQRAVEESQGSR